MKTIVYIAQNTGCAGGKDWFNNHGPDHPWYRHASLQLAIKDAKIHKKTFPELKHRVVCREIKEDYLYL